MGRARNQVGAQVAGAWAEARDSGESPPEHVRIYGTTRLGGLTGNTTNTGVLATLTSSGGTVPWLQADGIGNTAWGDYEGMAADPYTGAFYPAWGDDRGFSNGLANVWSNKFFSP